MIDGQFCDGEPAGLVFGRMWAFFSSRFRTWLILAIATPAIGWALGKIGDLIEARRGPNVVSRALQTVRGWLLRWSTGPFAPHPAVDAAKPAR